MKILNSILFFTILGAIVFFAKPLGFGLLFHSEIWIIFAFFSAIALFNNQIMKFAFEKNREKFVTFFMASVVIRLILSLVFLGTFIFIKLEDVQLFAINFIVLYLCVLGFEIFEISRNLRQN